MLKLTLEYLRHGSIDDAWPIGEGIIANDGTGTELKGNYQVKFTADHNVRAVGYHGQVNGFSRDRDAWQLVYEALKEALEHGPR